MSTPLTTADLSTTSSNLKALIDGHLEDKWPTYSNFDTEVNPDAPAISAYKN
ncbi:MAG: hypothetical protein ABIT37_13320 [Luteolibacter sp.]